MVIAYVFVLTLIAWVDWHKRIIWHALTIPATLTALFVAPSLPAARWEMSLLGYLSCGGLLLTIWWFVQRQYGAERFGFGDVMLGGLIGAIFGLVNGLWVLAGGMLLAGSYALFRLWQGSSPQSAFAYGTFLSAAAILTLLSSFLSSLIQN